MQKLNQGSVASPENLEIISLTTGESLRLESVAKYYINRNVDPTLNLHFRMSIYSNNLVIFTATPTPPTTHEYIFSHSASIMVSQDLVDSDRQNERIFASVRIFHQM